MRLALTIVRFASGFLLCIAFLLSLSSPLLADDAAALEQWTRQCTERFRGADEPYPCWRGPLGNGAGLDTGEELVPLAANAKFLWASEEIPGVHRMDRIRIPGLPGAGVLDPAVAGGFASPVVAYGKVYLYYYVPSGEAYTEGACEEYTTKSWVIGRRAWYVHADDVLHCWDAHTGKTLWRRAFRQTGVNHNYYANWKAGGHFTPCVADGRVYFIGTTFRLFCIDAETGEPIWQTDTGRRHEISMQSRALWAAKPDPILGNGGWCHGTCPAYADGVIACNDGVEFQGGPRNMGGTHLAGFDGKTGRPLWKVQGALMALNSPIRWIHGDSEYFISPGQGVFCVEPRTGRVLWKIPPSKARIGVTLGVADKYLIAARPGPAKKGAYINCWRITPEKATLAWESKTPIKFSHQAPVIYDGHVYIKNRGALVCFDILTGASCGRSGRFGGSVSSPIAFNGHILAEAGGETESIEMIKADPGNMMVSGRPILAGYVNSVTPAVAYNRVYFRNRWRLLCYDLRQSASRLTVDAAKTKVAELFGDNERRAGKAAIALANVAKEAEPIRDVAFQKCLTESRPRKVVQRIHPGSRTPPASEPCSHGGTDALLRRGRPARHPRSPQSLPGRGHAGYRFRYRESHRSDRQDHRSNTRRRPARRTFGGLARRELPAGYCQKLNEK